MIARRKKAVPAVSGVTIQNCNFNNIIDKQMVEAIVALANAAKANAEAIEAIASKVRVSDAPMMQIGAAK